MSAGFDYTIPAGGENEVILHGDFYRKGAQCGVAPAPHISLTETARLQAYNLVNATVTLRFGGYVK
jgi:hypothetical protein